MKKITLLGVLLVVVNSLFSQNQLKWDGSQALQDWDNATANWLDPTSPLPFPEVFVDASDALFDDTSVEGSDTIKVNGTINVGNINVNATKTYVLRQYVATDVLAGTGTFTKDGTADFVMDVKSTMLGGTNLLNGRLKMEKQTTANIFGVKLVFNGGIANFATTTSSSYPNITVPIEIPAGKTANVELSRYSYWSSPITGSGDLHIYAGGERTYLGQKSVQPNWSGFTGNVLVDKYVMTGVAPGFYGLVLNTKNDFTTGVVDSIFMTRKLTLGTGAAISSESGTRGYAIGELNSVDSTAWVMGYYKSSTSPKTSYMVGGLNTDVVFPGKIAGYDSKTTVGLIKVGTGTYTLTNSNNQISQFVDVREGRVLICDKNLKGKYNGGTGYGVFVKKIGTLGGTGRIAGAVDCYGTLQPGANGIGTLLLSDSISVIPFSKYGTPFKYSISYKSSATATSTFTYTNGGVRTVDLILREGSVSEFEIANVNSYDKVNLTGKIRFSKDSLAAGKPKLKIKLAASGSSIKDGDRFQIITAKSLDTSLSNGFDIEYPSVTGVTWTVETKSDTVKLDKEAFTFVDHIKSFTNLDSVVTTIAVPDTMKITYKVVVVAHGGTGVVSPIENILSVYPNPTAGDVNFVSNNAEISSIEIMNLQGQMILRRTVHSTLAKLNLENFPRGIYYAKVNTASGTKVQKLLLQ